MAPLDYTMVYGKYIENITKIMKAFQYFLFFWKPYQT